MYVSLSPSRSYCRKYKSIGKIEIEIWEILAFTGILNIGEASGTFNKRTNEGK